MISSESIIIWVIWSITSYFSVRWYNKYVPYHKYDILYYSIVSTITLFAPAMFFSFLILRIFCNNGLKRFRTKNFLLEKDLLSLKEVILKKLQKEDIINIWSVIEYWVDSDCCERVNDEYIFRTLKQDKRFNINRESVELSKVHVRNNKLKKINEKQSKKNSIS